MTKLRLFGGMPQPRKHGHALDPTLVALRLVAKKRGITAYRIAQETGLSISATQRLLNGAVSPTLITLKAVAGVVGLEVHLRKKR